MLRDYKGQKNSDDCRVMIYGIAAILKADPRKAPQSVQTVLPQIMKALVFFTDRFSKERIKDEADAMIDTQKKDATVFSQLNLSQEMIDMVSKLHQVRLNQAQGNYDDDEDYEDDDDDLFDDHYMFDPMEDAIYDSPLEKPEAAIYLK